MSIPRQLPKQFIILILLCFAIGNLFAQSRQSDYLRREFGKHTFVYCPEDSSLIEPLWNSLRTRIPIVEQQLRLSLSDSVRFIITPSEREWARLSQGSPLWANGIAYASQGVAVLKSPSFGIKYGGPLPVTALHEYVHLLLESGAPDANLPRWLNEGLAQLLASQIDYRDATLISRAVVSNRLHRLWRIEGMLGMSDSDARLAYAQSLLAVEWLRDKYGQSGLSNLVHELRAGKSEVDVFPAVFGMPVGAFESQLIASMQATYGGTSILTNVEFWVPLLFVVLVFLAGIARYLHRKRTVERWREEEIGRTSPADPKVPYTINYTLIRKPFSQDDDENDKPHDNPIPGN
jgi:hypothetical protein